MIEERPFLLVEDDPELCRLIGSVLRPPGWLPVITVSGAEALAQLDAGVEPSVVVVDLGLPDMDGVTLIQRMTTLRPGLPILVLTVCVDERRILEALRAGARGYLFKEDLSRGLGTALGEVLAGGAPMSRAVARLVLDQLRPQQEREPGVAPSPAALTKQECRVLEEFARGLSYEQVAGILDISANTVRTYVRLIYDKLCVCSKTEAVLVALRLGLIAAPSG